MKKYNKNVNINASLVPRSKKEEEKGAWFQLLAYTLNLSISGRMVIMVSKFDGWLHDITVQ